MRASLVCGKWIYIYNLRRGSWGCVCSRGCVVGLVGGRVVTEYFSVRGRSTRVGTKNVFLVHLSYG